jgi:outer membrane protein assembly factor BamB
VPGRAVYATNAEGYLHAVDPATGNQRWRQFFDGLPEEKPVFADGSLYVAARTTSDDGTVLAFDAQSGSPRWSRRLALDKCALHVVAGTVLVAATNALHALDASSGEERWRAELTEPTPAVTHDRVVYCGDRSGTLHALDLGTGKARWRSQASPDGLRKQPWVDPAGGRIYVCDEGYNLVMVEPGGSGGGWQFGAGSENPPRGAAGQVFVAGGRVVNALDAATGDRRWRFDTTEYIGDLARPEVVDGTVYFGDTKGNFYALDVAGGSSPAPG